ncbi:hypothetical protein [Pseudalkalibacillus berkeleyi]|uniref:Uncharacterized protein n=1 Tax=Pseudalkalibacillus berkeleyi TaxID=1069813 RepID=A0ABS9GY04_9BACL|nr:hypothetical protein [Pseudalkalibacillus berkeleyi]MCF6136417.1 hypothetical protein [Pseudalkalibacillus berkeleyi]
MFFGLIGVIIYCSLTFGAGFYFSENAALKHSFHKINGDIVYEKAFANNNKVIIMDSGEMSTIKVVHRTMGILYRVNNISRLGLRDEKHLEITWSATQRKDEDYDNLVAAKVLNQDIEKVIVTHRKTVDAHSKLMEMKKNASLWIEMEVLNGYASDFRIISMSELKNYTFIGVNAKKEIVSIVNG